MLDVTYVYSFASHHSDGHSGDDLTFEEGAEVEQENGKAPNGDTVKKEKRKKHARMCSRIKTKWAM
jgi:hypothetical protein